MGAKEIRLADFFGKNPFEPAGFAWFSVFKVDSFTGGVPSCASFCSTIGFSFDPLTGGKCFFLIEGSQFDVTECLNLREILDCD